MRSHVGRAESELQAAQHFLNSRTANQAKLELVRAIANARTSIGDTLETAGVRLEEREQG
jgi:hypothetical protein